MGTKPPKFRCPRVADKSPRFIAPPSPFRKNWPVVRFSTGHTCVCALAKYLGTGSCDTWCAPGRLPCDGRVWSKHYSGLRGDWSG